MNKELEKDIEKLLSKYDLSIKQAGQEKYSLATYDYFGDMHPQGTSKVWDDFKKLVTKKKYKDVPKEIRKTEKYSGMWDYHQDIEIVVDLGDYKIEFVRCYEWFNRWDKPRTILGRRHVSDRFYLYDSEGNRIGNNLTWER